MDKKELSVFDYMLKKTIQQKPEQYQEEKHSYLFTAEEIKNLSQSLRN